VRPYLARYAVVFGAQDVTIMLWPRPHRHRRVRRSGPPPRPRAA